MFDLETLPTGEELEPFLAERTDEELAEIEAALVQAMTEANGDGDPSDEALTAMREFRGQLDAARQVQSERSEAQEARNDEARALMQGLGDDPDDSNGEDAGDGGGDTDGDEGGEGDTVTEGVEGELVPAGAESALVASIGRLFDRVAEGIAGSPGAGGRDLNRHVRLGDIQRHAPDPGAPPARSEAVIVASADVSGFTQGGRISDVSQLALAMHARSRSMGVSRRGGAATVAPVASLQREYRYTIGKNPTYEEINEILKAAADVENLLAAGTWCAPSEINYNFFNVVGEGGGVDLPSVGTAERGGISFPVSPSFGDIIANFSGGLWTWTEEDDGDALDSDSPRKPCVRVPCPTHLDVRLACDGLCVTAGNLVDFAYPEAVENFLRLVFAARFHLTNARIIDLMVNGGTQPDDIGPSIPVDHTGLPGNAAAAVLSSVELSAIDYRTKFRMDEDAVLEYIFPVWAVGPIKADLSNRTGVDFLGVTNAMIANWFNLKNVRVQFVQDWQTDGAGEIGGTNPAVEWPDELEYLMYAPGTFVRANGLSLDLGVIRDSVLNETNDHTAAWMEDCYLVHKPGHESRVVTVNLCDAGETGAANIVCPS